MCDLSHLFGGGGGQQAAAASAQQLANQEGRHAKALKSDIATVDNTFSQFTPAYYNAYTQAYMNNYNPQLDYDYGHAQQSMEGALADNDQIMGSTGAADLGNLYQTYAGARGNIANSATDATNALKSNVSNAETNLYGLAEKATDPLQMAQDATAAGQTLVSPAAYPTMSNVFANALSPVASAAKSSASSSMGGGGGFGSPGLGRARSPIDFEVRPLRLMRPYFPVNPLRAGRALFALRASPWNTPSQPPFFWRWSQAASPRSSSVGTVSRNWSLPPSDPQIRRQGPHPEDPSPGEAWGWDQHQGQLARREGWRLTRACDLKHDAFQCRPVRCVRTPLIRADARSQSP